MGSDTASAASNVYTTTEALVAKAGTQATSGRVSALATSTTKVVDCPAGGIATLDISTGDSGTYSFQAGNTYKMTYTQCRGASGLGELNGSAELDVTSVSTSSNPVTSVTIVMSDLSVGFSLGSASIDGSVDLSHSWSIDGEVTTTTDSITSSSLTLTTGFNKRSHVYTLTDLSASLTTTLTSDVISGTEFKGSFTLSGTDRDGASFSETVSNTGGVTYDSNGVPISGEWTTVFPSATIDATVTKGSVTLKVDDGSDGSVDNVWTFATPTLISAAG